MFSLEYCVNISKTTSIHHKDFIHRDRRDISPAFVFYLGNFSGAELVCFNDEEDRELAVLGEPYRMGVFDPRLPHMVCRSEEFHGTRYCVIFFKMWDNTAMLAPFFTMPRYLEGNVYNISTLDNSKNSPTTLLAPFAEFSLLVRHLCAVCQEGTRLFFIFSSNR